MFRCISLHRRWTVLRETRTFEYLINFQLSAGGSHKFRHARGSLKSWERSRSKREIKKRWLGRGESWPGVRLLKTIDRTSSKEIFEFILRDDFKIYRYKDER